MKLDKILVPLDGSLRAEHALPKAVELIGGNLDATIILVRAVQAKAFPGADVIDAQVSVVREAQDYLDTIATRLRGAGVPEVRTSVFYGTAATAILETARRAQPDVIMMSTHGRSGLGRLVLGSVTESVLRSTRTPLFLIRVDGGPVETSLGRADTREQEAAHV